jgi:large subunit ribosomal protein L21
MYAIVKTGGKQYRVEKGQTLLVEKLPEEEGAKVALQPLLYRSDDAVFDGADLEKVQVEATILAHEKGPKIRIVKFKPKRGYKRTTGHRQSLTRIEVTDIKMGARRAPAAAKAAEAEAGAEPEATAPAVEKAPAPKKPAAPRKPAASKTPAAEKKPAAAKKPAAPRKPAAKKPAEKEAEDGS